MGPMAVADGVQFLVKRKGLGCHDYGVVSACAAKRKRLQLSGQPDAAAADEAANTNGAACPVDLAMVEEYEVRPHPSPLAFPASLKSWPRRLRHAIITSYPLLMLSWRMNLVITTPIETRNCKSF